MKIVHSSMLLLLLVDVSVNVDAAGSDVLTRKKNNNKGRRYRGDAVRRNLQRRNLKSKGGDGGCEEFPGGGKGYSVVSDVYCQYTSNTLSEVEIGDTVSCDVKLTGDVDCTQGLSQGDRCIIIDPETAGRDLEFDCNGYSILGPGITNPANGVDAEKGILINPSSQYKVTLKNCNIENFDDCIHVRPADSTDLVCPRTGNTDGVVSIESTKVEGCDNGILA